MNKNIQILKHFLYVALTLLGQQVDLTPLPLHPMTLNPLTEENLPLRGGPRLRKLFFRGEVKCANK